MFVILPEGKIGLDKEGCWLFNGEPMVNEAIIRLFFRSLRRTPEGLYVLEVGDECVAVDVEDTPFVVRHVSGGACGDYAVLLNDGSTERLALRSLRIDPDGVPRCRVKGGMPARFSRMALLDLSAFLREDTRGYFLPHGKNKHYLQTTST
jgi:hypothetical protein